MPERFGTPKEYASYYKLLLTNTGRREFLWWLERENPSVFQLLQKELARDRKASRPTREDPQEADEG